jgi:hypothetical protein
MVALPPAQAPLPTLAAQPDIPVTAAAGWAADHRSALRPVDTDANPAQSEPIPGGTVELMAPPVPPAAAPATAPVVAAPPAHPAPAAEQVAPALLTLAKAADGSQQITIRLRPAELGMVQVRIATAVSGTTQIEITADNPATLLTLQRDQLQLHRTLDEAGIPAAGRTVTFHVAPAEQAAASGGSGASAGHGNSQQGSNGRTQAGTTDADGSAGRGSHPARERSTYPTSRRPSTPPAAAGANQTPAGTSNRIGLDITAWSSKEPNSMSGSILSSAVGSTPSTASAIAQTGTSALGSLSDNFTDFLSLLMTQLQNQDPTSPLDSNQFTSELVQFTSVEQQISTNTDLTQLIQLTQASQIEQSASFIGKSVTVNSTQL